MKILLEDSYENLISKFKDEPYGIYTDMFQSKDDKVIYTPNDYIKFILNLSDGSTQLKISDSLSRELENLNSLDKAVSIISDMQRSLDSCVEVKDKFDILMGYKQELELLVGMSMNKDSLIDYIEDEYTDYHINQITNDYIVLNNLFKLNLKQNGEEIMINTIEVI